MVDVVEEVIVEASDVEVLLDSVVVVSITVVLFVLGVSVGG